MAWTSPRTWVSGEVLTAALLNVHLRDNLNALGEPWTGYAQVTANQTGITAVVDLTGLTVTVTTGTSRRIKITGEASMQNAAANLIINLSVVEGATILGQRITVPSISGISVAQHVEVILTPTAGAHTYKLRASSTSTAVLEASATMPAFILVEDLGAA